MDGWGCLKNQNKSQMRTIIRKALIFLGSYALIGYLAIQVITAIIFKINPNFYMNNINLFFSASALLNFPILIFTGAIVHTIKYCSISKVAFYTEVLFTLCWMFINDTLVFNTMIQLILGFVSLIITFFVYIKKFPRCNFAKSIKFIKDFLVVDRNCSNAMKRYIESEKEFFKNTIK